MADERKRESAEELIEDLQQHLLLSRMQERFEEEAREHRKHLERLLDRTMKVLYTVATIIVGGATIFGVKTYFDVKEGMHSYAADRLKILFNERFVNEERDKLIAQYKRGAVVGYYAARASDDSVASNSKFRLKRVPDQDLATVIETLDQPESPFFQDALQVVRAFDSFKRDNAPKVIKKLSEILAKIKKGADPEIPSDSQVLLVEAIATLRGADAFQPISEAATGGWLSKDAREKALAALPRVCPDDKRISVAEALLKNSNDLRKQDGGTYLRVLKTALQLDLRTALPEALALATSNDLDEVKGFPEFLNPNLFVNADEKLRLQVEAAIKCFVTNSLVIGIDLSARPIGGSVEIPAPANPDDEPTLLLITQKSRTEGVEERVLTPLFVHAIGETVCESSGTNRAQRLEHWVEPLIEFCGKRFEFEKRFGFIGPNADENYWQDVLTVNLVSSVPSNAVWQIVSVHDTNAILRTRSKTTESMKSREESVNLDAIDWSTLSVESNSVSSRRK